MKHCAACSPVQPEWRCAILRYIPRMMRRGRCLRRWRGRRRKGSFAVCGTRRNADDVETQVRLAGVGSARRNAIAARRTEAGVYGGLVGVRGLEPVLLHGQV